MALCTKCGAPLSPDEIGLTKKLINRGATEYQCKACLAAFFGCTTARLDEKIAQFRRDGCVLFAPLPSELSTETPPAESAAAQAASKGR